MHVNEIRDELATVLDEIDEAAAKESPTDEERVELEAKEKRADDLLKQLKEAEARVERKASFAAIKPEPATETRVEVKSEPEIYSPEADRKGTSFFKDVYRAQLLGDWEAQDRIRRHIRGTGDVETRDVGTGAFAGLTVPQYLTDLVAPHRKAGRPTLDICNVHPLPADGMTVNISRITTGSGTAAQASENTALTETNMDDTLLTVDVRTYGGIQDVSRQAIDRGTGIDNVVIADLVRDHDTNLDSAILNGAGTSGTHLGIRNVSGIVSVTYTDASPTAAEAYPKLFDLVQQVQNGVFMGVTHFVMHPRRFWWFAAAVGTNFPFLQIFDAPQGAGGQVQSRGYETGASGILAGVPVIVDSNIPTTNGAGTNEDVILGVTAPELHFWEESGAPLRIRAEEVLSNQLSVRFVVFSYSAFTAGRYPGAHGTITGTGLATPTF